MSDIDEAAEAWLLEHTAWSSPEALRPDLDVLRRFAAQALSALSTEFQDCGGIALLSDMKLGVRVHAGDGREACMDTTVANGEPHASLEMLAPSCQPAAARTNVNEPKNSEYVHKTIVHELSMLFLWQITRRKPTGWSFFSAPAWFTDGWEEFLALTCSSNHSRKVTLPEYRRRVKSRWTREARPALDRYLDGAIILEFVHHRFGHTPMIDLLRAKAARFDVALRNILGVDEDRLLTQWRAWLATQSQPGGTKR